MDAFEVVWSILLEDILTIVDSAGKAMSLLYANLCIREVKVR